MWMVGTSAEDHRNPEEVESNMSQPVLGRSPRGDGPCSDPEGPARAGDPGHWRGAGRAMEGRGDGGGPWSRSVP